MLEPNLVCSFHTHTRTNSELSVCEINYRCGSGGRPVICRCHYQFDYPEPEPIGTPTRTFKEACEEEEEAFLKGTGSTVTSGFFSTPTPSNGS